MRMPSLATVAGYDPIRERDREALRLMRETGCTFAEGWLKALESQERGRISPPPLHPGTTSVRLEGPNLPICKDFSLP